MGGSIFNLLSEWYTSVAPVKNLGSIFSNKCKVSSNCSKTPTTKKFFSILCMALVIASLTVDSGAIRDWQGYAFPQKNSIYFQVISTHWVCLIFTHSSMV